MIDTIRLNIFDVKVNSENNLITKKESFNSVDSSFDLYVDENGVLNQGVSAYINNDFYNLSIRPKININLYKEYKAKVYKRDSVKDPKSDDIWERKILKNYINVEFRDNRNCNFILQTSLSKLYSYLSNSEKKNLEYLNEDQIKESFKFLYTLLIKDGIIADLDSANVIRLDLFINLKTKYNFKAYKDFLKTIKLSRKELTEWENSFLFKNKQNQLCIYDKKKELEKSKIFLKNETIRFENRFLTKNKVKKIFGDNISEIILNKENQINQMKILYHNIFDNSKEKILIDNNIIDIISKSGSRKELKNNIYYYALSKNPSAFIEEMIKKHYSKTQVWKIKKEIENYSKLYGITNNFDLCNELKSKYENEVHYLEYN